MNPIQRYCATVEARNLKIVAIPGSGKTEVLTNRIANVLIKSDLDRDSILAVTLTNKAAIELRRRLTEKVGIDKVNKINVGTMHAVLFRALNVHASVIGYSDNIVIIETDHSKHMIAECMPATAKDGEKKHVWNTICGWKCCGKTVNDQYAVVNQRAEVDRKMLMACQVYEKYQNKLKAANSMAYYDILIQFIELLSKERVWPKLKFVYVDECQDLNNVQHRILRGLLRSHPGVSLTVVGDPDQCIFGFVDVKPRNFHELKVRLQPLTVVRLTENYRSTKSVILAAEHVIMTDESRMKRPLGNTRNGVGVPIVIASVQGKVEEAKYIRTEIQRKIADSNGKMSYRDVAVLVRLRDWTNAIVAEFQQNFVPFKLLGQGNFFKREEFSCILNHVGLYVYQTSEYHLVRVLRQYGVTDEPTLNRCVSVYSGGGGGAVVAGDGIDRLGKWIEENADDEHAQKAGVIMDGHKRGQQVYEKERSVAALIEFIVAEYGYVNWLKESFPVDWKERYQSYTKLLGVAKNEANASSFMNLAVLHAKEDDLGIGGDDDADFVSLATIHCAKGSEWPVVFITHCNEDEMPFHLNEDVEEERRIMYVAMSRAKFILHCTHYVGKEKSRFLAKMPKKLFSTLSPSWQSVANLFEKRRGHCSQLILPGAVRAAAEEEEEDDFDDENDEELMLVSVVADGSGTETRHIINKNIVGGGVTIGRYLRNDVIVRHDAFQVSRVNHVTISCFLNNYMVEIQGDTWLNRQPCEPGCHMIVDANSNIRLAHLDVATDGSSHFGVTVKLLKCGGSRTSSLSSAAAAAVSVASMVTPPDSAKEKRQFQYPHPPPSSSCLLLSSSATNQFVSQAAAAATTTTTTTAWDMNTQVMENMLTHTQPVPNLYASQRNILGDATKACTTTINSSSSSSSNNKRKHGQEDVHGDATEAYSSSSSNNNNNNKRMYNAMFDAEEEEEESDFVNECAVEKPNRIRGLVTDFLTEDEIGNVEFGDVYTEDAEIVHSVPVGTVFVVHPYVIEDSRKYDPRSNKYYDEAHVGVGPCPQPCRLTKVGTSVRAYNTHMTKDQRHLAVVSDDNHVQKPDWFLAWVTTTKRFQYAWYRNCGGYDCYFDVRVDHTCKKPLKWVTSVNLYCRPLYATVSQFIQFNEFANEYLGGAANYINNMKAFVREHCRKQSFNHFVFAKNASLESIDQHKKIYIIITVEKKWGYSGRTYVSLKARLGYHSNGRAIKSLVNAVQTNMYYITVVGYMPQCVDAQIFNYVEAVHNFFSDKYVSKTTLKI